MLWNIWLALGNKNTVKKDTLEIRKYPPIRVRYSLNISAFVFVSAFGSGISGTYERPGVEARNGGGAANDNRWVCETGVEERPDAARDCKKSRTACFRDRTGFNIVQNKLSFSLDTYLV